MFELHIGGWKAEAATDFVAMHDLAGNAVRAAQILLGERKIACG
jgi:hypothetical protein